jgi:hypothetical protein
MGMNMNVCDQVERCVFDQTCGNWHNCAPHAPPAGTREEIRAAMLAVWVDRAERKVSASPEDHVDALVDAVMPIVERTDHG